MSSKAVEEVEDKTATEEVEDRGVVHERPAPEEGEDDEQPRRKKTRRGRRNDDGTEEASENSATKVEEMAAPREESNAVPLLPGGSAISDAIRKAQEMALKLSGAAGIQGNSASAAPSTGAPGTDTRVRRKVYVPVEQYPDMNWRGLLIGPRGSTQKRLESDSGCRVLIRGEGAQREGAPPQDGDDEKLHVLIIGDSEGQVKVAEDMVNDIIFNPDTTHNLKRDQLSHLASVNGPPMGGAPGAVGTRVPTNAADAPPQELMVADRVVGLIIGRGGENIRLIQE
eukprot:g5546.t1